MCRKLIFLLIPLVMAGAVNAATTYTWEMVSTFNDWSVPISDDDVLEGMVGDHLAGGFHTASPGGGDPCTCIPLLTDGQLGDATTVILQDFAAESLSLHVRYYFDEPNMLLEVRTFGGNPDRDGRVFQDVDFEYKDADGNWHEFLHEATTGDYYRSNPGLEASLIRVYDDTGGPLLGGEPIYGLGFKFYLVDNTMNWFLPRDDPGVNSAPIIKEIDAILFEPVIAHYPNPRPGEVGVGPEVVLSWTPGIYVQDVNGHDIYLGTDYESVRDANIAVPLGVLLKEGHDTNSISAGTLELGETYYWRVDEVNDVCEPYLWKGIVWSFTVIPATAWDPSPAAGATTVAPDAILSWRPGAYAADVNGHDVYFGTNFSAVTNATVGNPLGVYMGRQDANNFDPEELELAETYYWRIDEVNDVCAPYLWPGSVWSFTVITCIGLDNFEDYNDPADPKITDTWLGGGDAMVYLERTIVLEGEKSMRINYYGGGPYYYSEATRTFDTAQDWTANGIRSLELWFRGAAANDDERLYVALEDTATNRAEVEHPSPDLQNENWRIWRIDLQDFAGVDLANVKKISIGLGDGQSPAGSGDVYIDNILLCGSRCIAPIGAAGGDLNGDCVVDFLDFAVLADNWLATGIWP